MSGGYEEKVEQLQAHISMLEQRINRIEAFLNKSFNTSLSQGIQYNHPNDRAETGMGAIVGADRTTFI